MTAAGTPKRKYFCPRCQAGYDEDQNFCAQCGSDMHRASRLDLAKVSPDRPVRESTQDPMSWASENRRVTGDPWLGRTIDNRYVVREIIGRGGMGVVYRVEHIRMGKIAAMKVLHSELLQNEEVVMRFRREAEAVSRLTHPNTVQVFDFGVMGGALYLLMEFVRGVDLGVLLDREAALPFERAAPIFSQICAALGEAHELGIVHRDLKPENILVTRTTSGLDFVKVLDFGLAKIAEKEEAPDVSGHGGVVGTPYYMAPEQIRGDEISPRTDIYALGALLYRALTGTPVFGAKTPVGVLTKHLTDVVEPPSQRRPTANIHSMVNDLVLKALAKNPADRFATVTEFLRALEEAHTVALADDSESKKKFRFAKRTASPAGSALNLDYGMPSELMLRRSDLDSFERSLKMRRWFFVFFTPVMLLAGAAAIFYMYSKRDTQPKTLEQEPNNEIATATLIPVGLPIEGVVGRRQNETQGDIDWFRLHTAPGDDQQVKVQLSAIRNIDLEVLLTNASGDVLARLDSSGVGGQEIIHRLRLAEPFLVRIKESGDRSPPWPTENVSDNYTLTINYLSADPLWEAEPNGTSAAAIAILPEKTIKGYLDEPGDVDWFRFDGPPGKYRAAISGVTFPGTALIYESQPVGGEQVLELTKGALFKVERPGSTEKPVENLKSDLPYEIGIVPVR